MEDGYYIELPDVFDMAAEIGDWDYLGLTSDVDYFKLGYEGEPELLFESAEYWHLLRPAHPLETVPYPVTGITLLK